MSTAATAANRPDLCRVWERRVWERFPCGLQTACQPIAARYDQDLFWPATIRDVSAGGVALLLQHRFEPGLALVIELPGAGPGLGDTLVARVVHVQQLPEGDWLVGCAFVSPLSEHDVRDLLRLAEAAGQPAQGSERAAPDGPKADFQPDHG
jgi:hypothetical protein